MNFKVIINNILKRGGFQFIHLETLSKLKRDRNPSNRGRYSLNSGERQVGTTVEEIRRDHRVRYELVKGFLQKNISDKSNLVGADIFCGNGYGSFIVSKDINCYMFGFDASEEAISLANKYYSNTEMFYCVKEFPFRLPSNLFDFIISFETIEHLVEDLRLLKEFKSSLKKGGYLFLSAPNEDICSLEKNNYDFHVKHYTFSDIINSMQQIGDFELISWYGNGACNFEEGVNTGFRQESEMELKEKKFDSHLTYIFRKG